MSHQQHKEDKEDITKEKYGTQDTISLLNFMKVEVSQNSPQKSEDGISKWTKVLHLWARGQDHAYYIDLLLILH